MADDVDDLSKSVFSPVALSTIEKKQEQQQQQLEKNVNNQVDSSFFQCLSYIFFFVLK